MTRLSNESLLALIEEHDSSLNPIGILIEMGRRKGFVTLDDILSHFPEAEEDISQLEEAFAALMGASIPYIEDIPEKAESEDNGGNQNDRLQPGINGGDLLENIDISDTPPVEYVPQIQVRFPADEWARMHEQHAMPENWHEMPYETFLQERRKLMASIIRRGFETLK